MIARLVLVLVLVLVLDPSRPALAQDKPGGPLDANKKERDRVDELEEKAKSGDLGAAKELVAFLTHKHQFVRADAYEALLDVTNDKVLDWLATEPLFDPNHFVRSDIIDVIHQGGHKRYLPQLLKLLGREDRNRQQLVVAIGSLGGSGEVEVLSGIVKKDKDARARAEAIEALARIDPAACAPLARAGFADADYEVRVGSLRAAAIADEDAAFDGALANLRERRQNQEKKKKSHWQPAFVSMKVLLGLRSREKRAEGLREAIDILIALLDKDKGESGRMRHEAGESLRALTGKLDIDDDRAAWEEWWEANRARFAPKDAAPPPPPPPPGGDKGSGRKGGGRPKTPPENGGGVPPPPGAPGGGGGGAEPPAVGTTVRFHGIPIFSDRVAFVIDLSGSMEKEIAMPPPEEPPGPSGTGERDKTPRAPRTMPKVEASKEELIRTIRMLPEIVMFNVCTYATEVKSWSKSLVGASKAAKGSAEEFVQKLKIEGRTNYFGAFQKPLEDPLVDCIFFLTDGGTTTEGRYIEQDRVARKVLELNKYALCEINCILFGDAQETRGGSDRRWMEKICGPTGGKFYVKP